MSNWKHTDKLPFGKHKGKNLGDVLKVDPSYLCWLRDQRKADGQDDPFHVSIHNELDKEIANSKQLAKQYKPWNKKGAVDLKQVMANQQAKAEMVAAAVDEREISYAGEWASW